MHKKQLLVNLLITLSLLPLYCFGQDDDGKIVDMTPFVPHTYETLGKKNHSIPPEKYQQCITWFNTQQEMVCKRITYLSQGLKIQGILATPKLVKGKKYPVIIFNRGGNRELGKIDVTTLTGFCDFIKAGFVVLASQYRGCDGSEGNDEFGGNDLNDILSLIKTAQSLDYVDAKNIFMLGGSRGGLMTYLALRNSDKIVAAAVFSGIADLFMWTVERPDMKKVFFELIPNLSNNMHEEFVRRSPTHWANEINTPLLIFHGALDERVSIKQADLFVSELKKYDKQVKYVTYPEGSHFLWSQYGHAVNDKIIQWFYKYI